ncbi:MAG: hypothetical protein WBX15_14565 [Thermoanaerobaculia bacterium]
MTETVSTMTETEQRLGLVFQYTVEAYKVFEKLAEVLPNPITAGMFENFAEDERGLRDLLEIKYSAGHARLKITLGADLRYLDMVEGDLSYREMTEMMIARERAMEKKLNEWVANGSESDRNLFHYLAATKRAHLVFLDRELTLIQFYPQWFRREDAESLIVHGTSEE